MIRANIQQHAYFRPETINGVELKAADFRYNDLFFLIAAGIFDQRFADIAADKNADTRIFKHLPQKLGGCGLAVCAGYGNDRFLDES